MPKRRMVADSIFSHPDFYGLPDFARLIYLAMLLSTDDEGRCVVSPEWLRNRVWGASGVRAKSIASVREVLRKMHGRGLVRAQIEHISSKTSDVKYGYITNFNEHNTLKSGRKRREENRREENNPPNPPQGGRSAESEEIEFVVFELHSIVGGSESDILRAVKRVGHTVEDAQTWRQFLKNWGKQNPQFTHPGRACRAEVLGNRTPELSTLTIQQDDAERRAAMIAQVSGGLA